jgi:type I restriction enzyme, S subunit
MASKRRYIPASEFCASVRDGTHDSPKPVQNGRQLVTSRHLTSGRLDLSDAYLISEEDFEAINKRSKVDRWDVLISMIGTVGEPCLVKEEPDFAIKNIGLFKTKNEVDGKWLYYFLRSNEAQQSVREQSRGTTQQYIPLGALRKFPVLVCTDPNEQKAIVEILGALDDKIELNRQLNATLETMARTLFQSWFVDFEPVRAKQEGRTPPGLDNSTAVLFPDQFQDSELGPIPKGWRVSTIGDEVEAVGGGTPSTTNPLFWENGTYHWVTPKDLSGARESILLSTERKVTQQGLNTISSGLLPINTVLMSSRAPVGYLTLAKIPTAINQGFIAMKCNKKIPPEYVLQWAQSNLDRIKQMASGSTFAEISKKVFRPIPVIVPTIEVLSAFANYVGAIYDLITANTKESKTLESLRDCLLPDLLSGKHALPDSRLSHE